MIFLKVGVVVASCGQASIEYLILIAAFFGIFAATLPIISSTVQGFVVTSDASLAKQISLDATEQAELFKFLADGSVRILYYFPAKSVVVYSKGNQVFFAAGGKEYFVECFSPQIIERRDLNSKFSVVFEKKQNIVQVSVKID